MSQLSKQDLKAENQLSFPNNNNGAITPADLRAFNVDMIDSTVNQTSFDSFSGSVAGQFASLTQSVDPSITGSSLITASFDNGTRNLTFTKGNNTTFNVNIPDVSGSTLNTGSFATTGSNTFTGIQNFSSSITASNTLINGDLVVNPNTSTKLNGNTDISSFLYVGGGITLNNPGTITWLGSSPINETFSSSVDSRINSLKTATGSYATTGSNTFTGNQIISQSTGPASLTLQGGEAALELTASNSYIRQTGVLWFRNQNGPTGFRETNFVTRNADINFSADRGFSFGRTDGVDSPKGLGSVKMNTTSGSLVLAPYGNSVTTASLLHLSSSTENSFVNLIFKNNDNTADTIISGSNNIFTNFDTPQAGFKRYIGGSRNIINTTAGPQISGSMQFSPGFNANYSVGVLNMRGPVSSSAWNINSNVIVGNVAIGNSDANHARGIQSGLTMTGNNIAGTLVIFANKELLSSSLSFTNTVLNGTATINVNSSSLNMANNNINDSGFILNNNFFSGSAGVGISNVQTNNIGGASNTITIQGTLPVGTGNTIFVNANTILGGSNTLFVDPTNATVSGSSAYHSAVRNIIGGNQLIVSGSSLAGDASSLGSAYFGRYNAQDGNKSKTAQTIFAVGTGNSTTRKTGFLIDSGSNTFIEGTLNVSGSTTMTGSLTIQSGSGDLFVHGNKQFNVGTFFDTTTQSGSAAVSQSMKFNTTDISKGVSIVSNSQITLANSGTYNIQFSAQVLADTGADDVYIWLKKNGTNVPSSAGVVYLANNQEVITSWNYVVEAAANDYYELCWQSTNGDAVLLTETATGNVPGIPSVILTVTQVR